jgi:hypothetical protein
MTSEELYKESLNSAKLFFDTKLSDAQRRAIHHAWTDRDGCLRLESSVCRWQTRAALEKLGVVHTHSYRMTDFGRLLFAAQS